MSLRLPSKRRIIGWHNGCPVYGISGARPEGDDNTDNTDGTDDSGDGDEGDGGTDGEDKSSEAKKEVISKEEYDALKARMVAADKNTAEALKKVKEYEDKDKSETERLSGQVEELTKANETLAEENKRLKFDNAFALNSKHSWQDPEIVLGLVRNHAEVTIEDDGTVKGLDKALEDISKTKPFLLKDKEDTEENSSASGTSTGAGRKKDKTSVDQDSLRKKYPALNI